MKECFHTYGYYYRYGLCDVDDIEILKKDEFIEGSYDKFKYCPECGEKLNHKEL